MPHTVTRPFQASSSCIPCHIFFYWTRLNISYRDIYDVLFKVFFYTKNGWISQKNLIYMYTAYLRFLNKLSRQVLGIILGVVLNYETKLKCNERNEILRNTKKYEQEYGIWTVSDNDRKLIKLDISLIYLVILWPNGWLVC